jgi:hypothetical protein
VNLAEVPAATLPVATVVQIEPVGRRRMAAPALMSFGAFCTLVGALRPPVALHLHGEGEPLLHPRFFDMVAFAAARGLEVSATTGMPALSARRAEECVQSGLARLHVLLGPDPTALARRGLARLEEAKRRLGSARPQVILADAAPVLSPAARIAFSGKLVRK